MADTARGQVIGSLREIADYVVEHEDTATAANALRTAADEIERLRESAKSDKADSTPIRVGSGSTTPKEREERHSAASPSRPDRTGLWLALLLAWSIASAVVYALFPSSDTNAVIAETIWIVGVVAWLLGSACRRG